MNANVLRRSSMGVAASILLCLSAPALMSNPAWADGSISSVNGAIHVEGSSPAGDLSTVNGAINVEAGGHIGGAVSTVNGGLMLGDGVDVAGDLSNVNGRMHLAAVHIAGSVRTCSGDIYVGPGSRIDGGIHVCRPHPGMDWLGWFGITQQRIPKVVIAPGAAEPDLSPSG